MNDARAAKRPFDFKVAIPRLRKAVRPYPKAAMFELAALGHGSVFELLVGCIISVRTRDETTAFVRNCAIGTMGADAMICCSACWYSF